MLARHRQSLILEDVRRAGSARVSDLTQRLGVSDMTIRRDLEVLARAGLIEGDKRGKWTWWRIVPDRLAAVRQVLGGN